MAFKKSNSSAGEEFAARMAGPVSGVSEGDTEDIPF